MRKAAKGTFRRLPLCMAMLGCLYGGSALAQQAPTKPAAQQDADQEEAKKDDVKELEKVTVTGSLLRPLPYAEKSAIATELRCVVWPLLHSGQIHPVIHRVFPLECASAHGTR